METNLTNEQQKAVSELRAMKQPTEGWITEIPDRDIVVSSRENYEKIMDENVKLKTELEQAQRERDEANAASARLAADSNRWAGLCGVAERERDDLRAKLLTSEAGNAEMREFIYRTVRALGKPFAWSFAIIEQFVEQANKLLSSTTFGQSFLAERERHVKALEEIAGYGKDGICPYGCDCPNIARTALETK